MPYSFDLLEQEQKKKQNGEENQLGAPEMTGGGQQFTGGGPSGMPAQQQAAPQQKGTNTQGSGFVSLDKYMKANQGNQLGAQVTGNVQSAVDQGRQALDQGAKGFADASDKGSTKWNNIESDVKNTVDSAGANTTADDAKRFQSYANANYQGPESFTGTAYGTQAQGAAQKANQQSKALQTEGGRFALLDQFFGRPTYNTGQKSLDNLLVQNDRSTAAKSQAINAEANNLSNAGIQKSKELDSYAGANRAATQEAAKNARDYVGGATKKFGDDLSAQLKDAQAKRDATYESLRGALNTDELSDDQLKEFGLSQGQHLYDIDLSQYLSPGQALSLNQTLTPEEIARSRALSQMSGDEDPLTGMAPADRGQDYGFDKSRFANELQSRDSAYRSAAEAAFRQYFPSAKIDQMPNFDDPSQYLSRIKELEAQAADPNRGEDERRASRYSANLLHELIRDLTNVRNSFKYGRTMNAMTGKPDYTPPTSPSPIGRPINSRPRTI